LARALAWQARGDRFDPVVREFHINKSKQK